MRYYKLWINGEWISTKTKENCRKEIFSPYSGLPVAACEQASFKELEIALNSVETSFKIFRKTSRYIRSRLLERMAQGIAEKRREFVDRIISEAGKPLTLANIEVTRAIGTFALAAEEAKRLSGEVVPLDIDPSGKYFENGISYDIPQGPILAITPFNFPLNLVAHKVAPALAVGSPILLKPPPQAPGSAILLAELFEKIALDISDNNESIPLSAFQVFCASNNVVEKAVSDHRIRILSFTGSDRVGWMLQEKAIGKKVLLELGGNAAVIIHEDANLERAANRCAFGGFAYSGQICISVQRILAHHSIISRFQDLLLEETTKLGVGDPNNPNTLIGPLIDSSAADRVSLWIEESIKDGAKILTPSKREGNIISPTILRETKPHHRIWCEEVFGPTIAVEPYINFQQAIDSANQSRYGLQAGLFTNNATLIHKATHDLDVGGLIVNEIPTYRADNMPYGGIKNSGIGREGVRYAMKEFCQNKIIVTYHK